MKIIYSKIVLGGISMKKVNIFERFVRSITDFNFSNHFVKEKTGKSIGLLFFGYLLFVVGLIVFLMITMSPFFNSLNNGSIGIVDEIPDFVIEKGEFSFLNNSVYYEKDIEGNKILFDLDNRNSDDYYKDNYTNHLLVRKDGLYQNGVMILGFNSFTTTVDKALLYNFISYLKPLLILILCISAVFGIIGLFILSAFVWAIAIIINGFVKSGLTSGDCYKVAVHAMVLPGVVFFLNWVLPLNIPYFFVIYLVIAGVYAYKFLSNYSDEGFDMETIYE